MMKALKLKIHGKVQGVGYRRWFEKKAIALNLKGYVKNLDSGEVEAVIIGNEDAIKDMLKCSLIGPLHAKVIRIDQQPIDVNDLVYLDFKMIR